MNCPKCGQPITQGAAFCGNCGQALAQPVVSSPAPPQAPAQVVQPQQTAQVAPTQPVTTNPPVPQTPAVQNPSTIAQVYANQPNVPTATVSNFTPPAGVGAANTMGAMPAYAATPINTDEHAGEVKAIIGLILGVIGIPASIIPILGLILGVTGLVLSTIARSTHKRPLTIFGIVFSSLAILAALALWVYAIAHDPLLHKNDGSTSTSSANLVSVSTPCYVVKIDGGLNNYKPSGCGFNAASTNEEFTVEGQSNPNVNSSNLDQVGQQALNEAASNTSSTVDSEQAGQFAGSPAYIATLSGGGSNAGKSMISALVFHPTSNGDNLFLVIHVVSGTGSPSFGSLESTWQWK